MMSTIFQRNNALRPDIPYHFLHEQEPDENGKLQEINTVFLTSRQCPYRCVMCDLWKNTRIEPTPPGAVSKQIDYALSGLQEAQVIKLYNNGNFFDLKAIPAADYPEIIEKLKSYNRLVVENQPKLCGKACLQFSEKLHGKLEVAMGLETIHPEVFPKLNKPFTLDDYKQASAFLEKHEIAIRSFILLNPPFLTNKEENIKWTLRTVQFAFENGAGCCSIIPTRPGTEFMVMAQRQGQYVPPALDTLEEVFERALNLSLGRVFVDTWDIEFTSQCPDCFIKRKERLEKMNLYQKIYPPISCHCKDK